MAIKTQQPTSTVTTNDKSHSPIQTHTATHTSALENQAAVSPTTILAQRLMVGFAGSGALGGILLGGVYGTRELSDLLDNTPAKGTISAVIAILVWLMFRRLLKGLDVERRESRSERLVTLMLAVSGLLLGIQVNQAVDGAWGMIAIVVGVIVLSFFGQLLNGILAASLLGGVIGFFFGVPVVGATVGLLAGAGSGTVIGTVLIQFFLREKEAIQQQTAPLAEPRNTITGEAPKLEPVAIPEVKVPPLPLKTVFQPDGESLPEIQQPLWALLKEWREAKKTYPIYFDPAANNGFGYLPTLAPTQNKNQCVVVWLDTVTDTPMFGVRVPPNDATPPVKDKGGRHWQIRQEIVTLLSTAGLYTEEVEAITPDMHTKRIGNGVGESQ